MSARLTPQYVMTYLINKGVPPHIAAGFAGNMMQESGGNMWALNKGENARGAFQWRFERQDALRKLMADRGLRTPDQKTTMDHLWNELQGSHNKAWKHIQGARDVKEATYRIRKRYEVAAGHDASRNSFAQAAMRGHDPSYRIPAAAPYSATARPSLGAGFSTAPGAVPAQQPASGVIPPGLMGSFQGMDPLQQNLIMDSLSETEQAPEPTPEPAQPLFGQRDPHKLDAWLQALERKHV